MSEKGSVVASLWVLLEYDAYQCRKVRNTGVDISNQVPVTEGGRACSSPENGAAHNSTGAPRRWSQCAHSSVADNQ